MQFQYPIIESVKDFMKDSIMTEIEIGCSNSQVIKIEKDSGVYYLKMAKKGLLTREYKSLLWLDGKLKVPKVILFDNYEEVEYLITEAIIGEMTCSKNLLKKKNTVVKVLAEAFQHLYQVDITNCPFNVALDFKLNLVSGNVANHLIDYQNLKEETKEKFSSLEEILTYLKENRIEEELCFSHGDTSLPNIFSNHDKFSGFIDVGDCGVADKWFDLAVCEKSIIRNLGSEYIEPFYKEMNIIRDKKKIDYYHLLMELYL